ncbi:hypothetical protein G6F66_006280 [Rhizopus arrhizus]|nr:hypothetical protein G6F66_006280 [Rhizopus arrhizus]
MSQELLSKGAINQDADLITNNKRKDEHKEKEGLDSETKSKKTKKKEEEDKTRKHKEDIESNTELDQFKEDFGSKISVIEMAAYDSVPESSDNQIGNNNTGPIYITIDDDSTDDGMDYSMSNTASVANNKVDTYSSEEEVDEIESSDEENNMLQSAEAQGNLTVNTEVNVSQMIPINVKDMGMVAEIESIQKRHKSTSFKTKSQQPEKKLKITREEENKQPDKYINKDEEMKHIDIFKTNEEANVLQASKDMKVNNGYLFNQKAEISSLKDQISDHTPMPVTYKSSRLQKQIKKSRKKSPVMDLAIYQNLSKRRLLKTGFVYDTAMSYHATPDPIDIHPEDPRRIFMIYTTLEKHGLLAECKRIKSRKATKEEITAIHKYSKRSQYIELEHIYDSIYLNASSFESGLYAAGSLIALLEALVKDEIRNAFAIIRPPGHHAEYNSPMGFCLFNNVAIAVNHCMKNLAVKKTLIVDWDIHFGNGTQNIFSENPNVLYISLHRYEGKMFYPADRKGAAEYTGHGKGEGTTVNIPWPCGGMTDADYFYAFKEVVIPIAMEFGPDLLVVSAGFDAAIGDPIGQCKVTPAGYAHMTHMLKSINNGKLAIALEGGYNLNSIALSALGCMNVLLGDSPPAIENALVPKQECIDTIKLVKKVQQKYWRCYK